MKKVLIIILIFIFLILLSLIFIHKHNKDKSINSQTDNQPVSQTVSYPQSTVKEIEGNCGTVKGGKITYINNSITSISIYDSLIVTEQQRLNYNDAIDIITGIKDLPNAIPLSIMRTDCPLLMHQIVFSDNFNIPSAKGTLVIVALGNSQSSANSFNDLDLIISLYVIKDDSIVSVEYKGKASDILSNDIQQQCFAGQESINVSNNSCITEVFNNSTSITDFINAKASELSKYI